jgi:hypothetical protein
VNGEKTEFLRKSQFEQTRSTELLTAACGFPVHAWPVIVFVDLAELEVKHQPDEVYVVARRRLVEWLQTLPAVLDPRTVEVIWANARWDTTWQPPGS